VKNRTWNARDGTGFTSALQDSDTKNCLSGSDLIQILEQLVLNPPVVDVGSVFTVEVLKQATRWPDIQQEMVSGNLPVGLGFQNEMCLGRSTHEEGIRLVEFKEATGFRSLNHLESNPHA